MGEIGMGSEDFAGFIKSPIYEKELENGEPDRESPITDYSYALRYGEFVALNTYMIQSMGEKIAALEKRIVELEGKGL